MTAEMSVSVREGDNLATNRAGATKQEKMEDANILYVEDGTSIEGCPGTMTGYGEL